MGDRRCCCTKICLIQSSALDSDKELTNHFNLEDAENFEYHEEPFDAIRVSAADQIATKITPHPQSPYPPRVQVKVYGDSVGSQVRLIVGGDLVGGVLDTSNAIAAQVTFGDNCAQLDLIDLSSDSEIVPTRFIHGADRNEWYTLTLCYDPDTGVVRVAFGDYVMFGYVSGYSTRVIGAYAAFATGPSHVSMAYFKDFYFWRLWYCGDPPYTEDCSDDYYYQSDRQYCFRCDPYCYEWTSDLSINSDCDWTVDSGSLSGETLSATATSITHNNEIAAFAYDGFSAAFDVTLDWMDHGVVGDSFTATADDGTITVKVEIISIDPVTCRTTLTGATGGVATDDFTLTSNYKKIAICVEHGIITANETYGELSAPVSSGVLGFSISSTTDVDLNQLVVNYLGRVTKSDGSAEECGFCSRPCTCCSDAFPAGLLVEISGLETFQILEYPDVPLYASDIQGTGWYCFNSDCSLPVLPYNFLSYDASPIIDCDVFNAAWYLNAVIDTTCLASYEENISESAQRSYVYTCSNPDYPMLWYGPDCIPAPYIVYFDVERVAKVELFCQIGGPLHYGKYKTGWTWTSNHCYLIVTLKLHIYVGAIKVITWSQYWAKDMGPLESKPECLKFNDVELEWVGWFSNIEVTNDKWCARRYCGGGYGALNSKSDIPVSSSIVKVTSI